MQFSRSCFAPFVAALLLTLPCGMALAFGGGLPAGPAVAPIATEGGRPIANSTAWTIGAGWAWTAASLAFGSGGPITLDQQAMFFSADRSLPRGWGLRLIGGALVQGTLDAAKGTTTGDFKLSRGWALGIGASRNLMKQSGKRPWVRGTAAITYGRSRAEVPGDSFGTLSNWDFRAGATVGWRVLDGFDLYAVGRGFMGPITWSSRNFSDSGADRWHVQFGVGAVLQLWEAVALHFEGCPLGERALVVGAALAL